MGVVYACEDRDLGRLVAIKTLPLELGAAAQLVELFLQEGRALAQLDHPGLVRVLDAREEVQGGRPVPYLVMELVEGAPMDAFLDAAHRPALPTALRWAAQIAEALAYCHGRGVVHRDVKPGNVLVRPGGEVKLIDFGLARPLEQLAQRSTQVRGTPIYMAPETVTGGTPGPATDVYALGVTLYELVSGAPPFVEGEMLYHHIYTPPPPLSTRCPVPPALEALALRCLAKDPLARPAAREMAEELRRLADELDGVAAAAPGPGATEAPATAPAPGGGALENAPTESAVAQGAPSGATRRPAALAALLGAALAALLLVPLTWHQASRREAAPARGDAAAAPGSSATGTGTATAGAPGGVGSSVAPQAAGAPGVTGPAAAPAGLAAGSAPAEEQASSDLAPAPDGAAPDRAPAPPSPARSRPRPRPAPAAAPPSAVEPAAVEPAAAERSPDLAAPLPAPPAPKPDAPAAVAPRPPVAPKPAPAAPRPAAPAAPLSF